MCGRYYISEEMAEELGRIVENLNARIHGLLMTKDVVPSMEAPVLFGEKNKIVPIVSRWGFQSPKGTGLVINARAERVDQLALFREPLAHHRCVVPAMGFYEWDRDKNKFQFMPEQEPLLYMAGICRYEEENRYVILTTEANTSMEPVHDRMPVVLKPDMLKDWIFDDSATQDILRAVPPQLNKYCEMQQMRLEF